MLGKCKITWDKYGQLTDGKNTIENSNIVDLLTFLTGTMVSKNVKLVGLGNVVSALKTFNAPLCLFGNEGKRQMQLNKQEDTVDGRVGKNKIVGWKTCEEYKLFK